MANRYTIDLAALTVLIHDDSTGEVFNADTSGDGCENEAGLREFIVELFEVDYYGADVRDELLNDLDVEIAIRDGE